MIRGCNPQRLSSGAWFHTPVPHRPNEANHQPSISKKRRRQLAPYARANRLLLIHLVDLHEPLPSSRLAALLLQAALCQALRALKLEVLPQPCDKSGSVLRLFPWGLSDQHLQVLARAALDESRHAAGHL